LYRIHGSNHGWTGPIEERLEVLGRRLDFCLQALDRHGRAHGLVIDPAACKAHSWHHWLSRLYQATREIAALTPPEAQVILVDDDTLENRDIAFPRRHVPFLERDGRYYGRPSDNATAIRELERLRRSGAGYVVFAWPAFWWLDYYQRFHRHLRDHYRCLLENDRVVIFDLHSPPAGAGAESTCATACLQAVS
jgi:hypothetical protein